MMRPQRFFFIIALSLAAVPALAPAEPLSDTQLDQSISDAMRWIFRQQKADGSLGGQTYRLQEGGTEALVALAAMQANLPSQQANLVKLIDFLKTCKPDRTLARCLRAQVYARLGDEYSKSLDEDVVWLIEQQREDGGWSSRVELPNTASNVSDTAAALLALRDAADAGALVSSSVWSRAKGFLASAQNADGGFGYQSSMAIPYRMRGNSNGLDTACGASGLGTLVDMAARKDETDRSPAGLTKQITSAELRDLQRAMNWLARNYTLRGVPQWHWGQSPFFSYLFQLCQATQTITPMQLGKHNLDQELSKALLTRQLENGSWPASSQEGSVATTAHAVMVLAKARQPVLLNKLILGKMPLVDVNDAAHLTRHVRRVFGYDATWRNMPPEASLSIMQQAPILYMAGIKGGELPEGFSRKLHEYLQFGGTILVQPIAGDELFRDGAKTYLTGLSSSYEAKPLPADDPTFMNPTPVSGIKATGIAGSGRPRIFLLESDLSGLWNAGYRKTTSDAFHWFGNFVINVTGRQWRTYKFNLPSSFTRRYKPDRFLTIGRLKHDGDWQVFGGVAAQLSEDLAAAVSTAVREQSVSAETGIPSTLPLLWMTGSDFRSVDLLQQKNLKAFIDDGGVLLLDSAVGQPAFSAKARALLEILFGKDSLQPIKADDPLLTGEFAEGIGNDIRHVKLVKPGVSKAPPTTPQLYVVRKGNRIVAILSPAGISGPASGNPPHDYTGYTPEDARRIALNILLYAYAAKNQALAE